MEVDDRPLREECPPTLPEESAVLHLRLLKALGSALRQADPDRVCFLRPLLAGNLMPYLYIVNDEESPANFRT